MLLPQYNAENVGLYVYCIGWGRQISYEAIASVGRAGYSSVEGRIFESWQKHTFSLIREAHLCLNKTTNSSVAYFGAHLETTKPSVM